MSLNLLTYTLSLLTVATTVQAYFQGPLYGSDFGIPGQNASYDYVVVGGGTAGLALAARLAENTSVTVAVIEAGGFYEIDNGNTSVVPGLGLVYDATTTLLTNVYPSVDWGLDTTPQAGFDNQTYHYWRGRTLGGSSALNNEVYQRGSKGSYQLWADELNDTSYTWDNLLPYFQKSAHYTSPDMSKRPANASVPSPAADAFIPDGGPLEVGYVNYPVVFGSWAQLAFKELGFASISDMDSGILNSVAQYVTQTIAPDMTRSSSESSYLAYALASGRQNLVVYPRTLAKRIVFDANLAATGVQVKSYQIPYMITADKEVIISSGTIHTPQLLMVSGIGPAATLQDYNIPVLVDSPGVGQNLWDHVLFQVTYRVNTIGIGALKDPVFYARAVEDYVTNRTGQFANSAFDFVAWEKLNRTALGSQAEQDLSYFPSDWPDLEYIIGEGQNPADTNNYASCIGGLVTPLSRGFVSIASNDTSVLPVFSPNWLTHPTDQKIAVEAFKRCRNFFAAEALQPVLIGDEFAPGKNITEDEDILAWIKQTATTIYHAAGTCKMGKDGDAMAVLDAKARVRGVQNLRVVDASMFPILPPGHPTATLYALAEKFAAEILAGS